MSRMLKSRIRTLEEKTLPARQGGSKDFFNWGWEDVPCPQTMTEQEKENVVRERVKGYIKRNWSRMDQTLKNCYLDRFSGLGLRLNGDLVEEAKPT